MTLALEIVEGWNGELMNLIIATIGSGTLAAQNIVFNIATIFWIFTAFGVSQSLAIFVGNAMGGHHVNLAKKISK